MEYTDIIQTAAIVFTMVAFGVTQYSNRKSSNGDSFIRINGEYNRMVAYRLEHPEVVQLAEEWKSGKLDHLAKDREAAKYYSYGNSASVSVPSACTTGRATQSRSRILRTTTVG